MNAAFLRRHLSTIILVALAVAGVLVITVGDRGDVTTQEHEMRKRNIVPAWRLDDIHKLALEAHGKKAVLTLGEPTDAGQRLWQVEIDGGKFLANQQTVDQLMGTLEYATYERAIAKGAVSDADLGLGEPVTRVTVEMGPKTYRVAVGGVAPTPKDARYCEADGRLFVITAQLAAALDMQPESLRTRTFVPYLSTELKGLLVDGEGGARHLARAAWSGSRGAGFRFDGSTPEGDVRAGAEAVDRVLGALGTLQAESFLADDEADRALKRRVTVTLLPKEDGQPKGVIDVGGDCPGEQGQVVAVRREPSRMSACVPSQALEALIKPASDLVDLAVLGARADDVTEVAITRGGRTLELARQGTGWHQRKPADRKVSAEAGDALLAALAALSGKRASGSLKELGLEPPEAVLRVTSSVPSFAAAGGPAERVETIEIGAVKGGVVHARRLEDGAALELSAEAARALSPSEVVLRDAAVLDLPRDQIKSLAIQGAASQKLTKGDGGWTYQEPRVTGLSADSGLVEDALIALSQLRAVRWVAEKDDGTFGLEEPRLTVELGLEPKEAGAPKTVKVMLGAASSDGVFARLGDDPAVFVAPPAVEQAVGLWLFDRQALVIDAAALVRVEASAGSKKIAAERAGGAWRAANGEGDAVAAALRSAVTGLIAEGVAGPGAPDRSYGLDAPRLTLTILADPEPGSPKGAPQRRYKVTFGAGDTYHGTSVVYARREGLDATFAIPLGRVRELFDAAGVR